MQDGNAVFQDSKTSRCAARKHISSKVESLALPLTEIDFRVSYNPVRILAAYPTAGKKKMV